MKKIIISIVAVIVLIAFYLVIKPTKSEPVVDDVDSDVEMSLDDLEGLELGFAPIKDPGVAIPSLERELVGLTEQTQKSLDELIGYLKEDHLNPDVWLDVGNVWQSGGNYTAAVEAWEYVDILDPMNEIAQNNLGRLYTHDIVDLSKAEFWYKKALESSPQYIVTYFNISEMYLYGMKNRKKAINIVKQGVKELPHDGSLQSLLKALESGGSI